jgi:hypothetical protein
LAATGIGVGLLLAVFLVFRSRRSTTDIGPTTPAETYAHT